MAALSIAVLVKPDPLLDGVMYQSSSKELSIVHTSDGTVGPFLYIVGADNGRVALAAVIVVTGDVPDPVMRTNEGIAVRDTIFECGRRRVVRYEMEFEAREKTFYSLDNRRYDLNLAFSGDLRVAFVSCNGQEVGDRGRDRTERNAMWRRLAKEHWETGIQLLLHGGDQIYADEVIDAHPRIREWADKGGDACQDLSAEERNEITRYLREAFFERYLSTLSEPESEWLMGRIPSLAIWDDHDICDGWGSMESAKLDSPIGQLFFTVAREFFLMFQLGSAPESLPSSVIDRTGRSLTWHVALPGLHVIAPDLRSERRWLRVMGDVGWRAFDTALSKVKSGRVLLLSSVPALGPRLSWVEATLHLFPKMQNLEDDLRDQWQSRAHRVEWSRFLKSIADVHRNPATPVTVLSGEIHLATRATFDVPPSPIHQLVASGISHPAPTRMYASALNLLARFGGTPVPGRSSRLHSLPGKTSTYLAQRNYLVLERRDSVWTASWELEKDGRSMPLRL